MHGARLVAAFFLTFGAGLCAPPEWTLTRTGNFEIYSDSSLSAAHSAAEWLEQLRAFLIVEGGDSLARRAPLRLVGFQSVQEYEGYRLPNSAAAYFVGTESRDYIVMPLGGAGPSEMRMLSHEYAHVLTHSGGKKWPFWFAEGFSEFLSTFRISNRAVTLGGDIPAHSQRLEREPLIGLETFLRQTSRPSGPYYAESWALVEMLVLSPEYSAQLPALLGMLASGTPSAQALRDVYGKSLDSVALDLRRFIARPKVRLSLAPPQKTVSSPRQSPVSSAAVQAVLAEVTLAGGYLVHAESMYRDLVNNQPDNSGLAAALGMIVLRKGNLTEARRLWNKAVSSVNDSILCYRYAVLAKDAGAPEREIRTALERAVELDPGFDDARYLLSTVAESLGDPESAVEQLRRMRTVSPERQFHYWISLSNAFSELGEMDEAVDAARRAANFAATPEQRNRAERAAYQNRTEFTVQIATGADGRPQMVGARKPRNSDDWNPFIEPGEEIRRADVNLLNIECAPNLLKMRVLLGATPLELHISDTSRVRMRNAPPEFVCGPQPSNLVSVEFVDSGPGAGLIRGMAFSKP